MIFHIALKDLKVTFKDKKAIILMLLMPILIILILGSAFGKTFEKEVSVSKFSVGVVNSDNGFLSKHFIDDVLKKGCVDVFDTTLLKENEAQDFLNRKKIVSLITIPENFTKNIENNNKVNINIESLSDNKFKSKIVESIADSFSISISNSYRSSFFIIEQSKKLGLQIPEGNRVVSQATMVLSQLGENKNNSVDFKIDEQEKNKAPSAIQYYSAGMLLMFILFGANQGIKLLIEERETKTLGRLLVSNAGKITVIAGKFLGLFTICLVQSAILIGFTYIVYGVNWGPAGYVVLVTLSSVFAGAALGMFIGSIAKTSKSADGISQIVVQLFTILGGGMVPVYIMPEAMKMISNVTINWWGMKGYIGLMSGSYTVLTYCGILVIMGLIYLSVGIKKFKLD